ncbi:hypothetical protein Clacol_009219 [Clathrus columnatus]|uniref:Succinate dehydrogenase assembly factor 2, mitochondrial n=1 Tax=Clathrus columnatus TaxID=1419009 RepID=A0AAV5AQG6_9AGAM|nr:hypothetical protein Clacol_009219 [Clathrus columnatus]
MYHLRTGYRITRNVINIGYTARLLSGSHPSDPFPLPLSHETQKQLQGQEQEQTEDLPARLPRLNESIQTLRSRLIYQSRKRGTLESDLLLSTFAAEHLGTMTEEEMKEFDRLMDEPDWDIYYWSVGKKIPPERWVNSPLLDRLKRHAANEGKVVRRMPDLAMS